MSHSISLPEAEEMTARFRNNKDLVLAAAYKGENILPISESFDRSELDQLLREPDCAGMRIYYGMDEKLQVHTILVGYNSKGEDILPPRISDGLGDDKIIILEKGIRCPDECPPPSPLNP